MADPHREADADDEDEDEGGLVELMVQAEATALPWRAPVASSSSSSASSSEDEGGDGDKHDMSVDENEPYNEPYNGNSDSDRDSVNGDATAETSHQEVSLGTEMEEEEDVKDDAPLRPLTVSEAVPFYVHNPERLEDSDPEETRRRIVTFLAKLNATKQV